MKRYVVLLTALIAMTGFFVRTKLQRNPRGNPEGPASIVTEARPDSLQKPSPRISSTRAGTLSAFEQLAREWSNDADPDRRQSSVTEFIRSLPIWSIPEISERIEAIDDVAMRSQWRIALLNRWAIVDPVAALESAQHLPTAQQRNAVELQVLDIWVRHDLPGALSWFGEQPSGSLLHQQAKHLLSEALGKMDPTTALDWLHESLGITAAQELLTPFFRRWAQHDPRGASDALLAINAGSAGTRLNQVIADWAALDPAGVSDWLQFFPDASLKQDALAQVNDVQMLRLAHGKWAVMQPESASRWATQLPDGDGKNKVAEYLATFPARRVE